MNSVLDLYRTGELHLPENLCSAVAARELEFWEIPTTLIHECCWRKFENHHSDAAIVREIDDFLHDPYDKEEAIEKLSVWNRIWFAMEHPSYSLAAKIWTFFYHSVVVMAVLLFSMETVPGFLEFTTAFLQTPSTGQTADDRFVHLDAIERLMVTEPKSWLRTTQLVVFAFFVIEFVVRLVTCPNKTEFLRQKRTWCDVILLTAAGVYYVVKLAVLQERVEFSREESHAIRFLYAFSMIRSFRVIYLTKHFDSLKILLLSAKSSVKELVVLVICVLAFVILFGSFAYVTDTFSGDYMFTSIPEGMWWAIITMTTVGYVLLAYPIVVVASKFYGFHDNLSPRQQMCARVDFLRDNPHFCNKVKDATCFL
nr:hypothetical protein BaRGS_032026 [Batillaria attramentaria]